MCIKHVCVIKHRTQLQWNLSIKDTLNKGYLSNEDTVCSPNHIELCINLHLNYGHLSIQDSQLGPNGVLYREVPLYTGQPAGSQRCPLREVPLYTGQPAGSQWCPL